MEEAAEVQLVVGLCWIIQITLEKSYHTSKPTLIFLKKKKNLPDVCQTTVSAWNSETQQMHFNTLEVLSWYACNDLSLDLSLIKQEILRRGPPKNHPWDWASSGSSESKGLIFSLFRKYWPYSKLMRERERLREDRDQTGRRGVGKRHRPVAVPTTPPHVRTSPELAF